MLASTPRSRRKASDDFMHGVVGRLNLLRSREAERARWRWRAPASAARTRSCPTSSSRSSCRSSSEARRWLRSSCRSCRSPEPMACPRALGAAVLGFVAPGLYVKNAADKRKALMQKGLPDALDLLVDLRRGRPQPGCGADRVAREIGAVLAAARRRARAGRRRARLPARAPPGARQPQPAHRHGRDPRRGRTRCSRPRSTARRSPSRCACWLPSSATSA